MMNRILLIAIFLFSSITISAQAYKTAFSFGGGIVGDGFGANVALDYKVNEFDYLQFSVQANFTDLEFQEIDVSTNLYAFNAGFYFDLIRNNSRSFALALGAGLTGGFESVNGGDEVLDNNQVLDIDTSKIVFGAFVGADVDIFLIPTFAINIKAQEVYHVNSDVGELTPYLGLGFKLILK